MVAFGRGAGVATQSEVARTGAAVSGPQPSPYGTMATVKDPAGAVLRLRLPNALPE